MEANPFAKFEMMVKGQFFALELLVELLLANSAAKAADPLPQFREFSADVIAATKGLRFPDSFREEWSEEEMAYIATIFRDRVAQVLKNVEKRLAEDR